MSRPFLVAVGIVAVGVIGMAVVLLGRHTNKPVISHPSAEQGQPASELDSSENEDVSRNQVPTSSASPTTVAAVASVVPPRGSQLLDEPNLMTTMRESRRSNPELSLRLAREGNERFKNSPDAAERGWTIVKCLTDLGRHDEALVEARAMFEKYKGTSWADDVHRHMLVNPPTHPLERGYGKDLELE